MAAGHRRSTFAAAIVIAMLAHLIGPSAQAATSMRVVGWGNDFGQASLRRT